MEDQKKSILIVRNKDKFIFLLILSALFFSAGLYILIFGDFSKTAAPRLQATIAIAAIVFFGGTLIYALVHYLKKKPALVINHQGILDQVSGISPLFIKWEDITGFNIAQVRKDRFVLIYTKEPNDYILNKSFIKQTIFQANMGMYGTPILIAASDIKFKLDDLVELLVKEQNKYLEL